jgi:hypothetical protein
MILVVSIYLSHFFSGAFFAALPIVPLAANTNNGATFGQLSMLILATGSFAV